MIIVDPHVNPLNGSAPTPHHTEDIQNRATNLEMLRMVHPPVCCRHCGLPSHGPVSGCSAFPRHSRVTLLDDYLVNGIFVRARRVATVMLTRGDILYIEVRGSFGICSSASDIPVHFWVRINDVERKPEPPQRGRGRRNGSTGQ